MTDPYAVPADITTRWIGDGAPTNTAQLTVLIADAGIVIRREFPDIDDRIDAAAADGGVSAEEVTLVVVAMVTRLYRNPEGLRSYTDTKGPFTEGKTFAGDNPGGLTLTEAERAILRGESSLVGPRAFTIDTLPAAGQSWIGGGWPELSDCW